MKLLYQNNIQIIPFKLFFVLTQLNKFRQVGKGRVGRVGKYNSVVVGAITIAFFSFFFSVQLTRCTRDHSLLSLNQPVNPLYIVIIFFWNKQPFPERSRIFQNVDRDYCAEEKKTQKAELLYKVNLFFYRMPPLLVPGQAYFQMQISLFIG